MSRMTSKPFVLSPVCSLSSSQSLHTAPLFFAFRDGALVVEIGHDADTALVAPFGGVACTHTHDSGIVCCIPHLRCRLPKQPLYARGLSRAEAMAATLMTKSAITYQLGLKERRDASSAAPPRASLRQARCPWGHLALCSVRSSRIARCRDATRSSRVCHRCYSACGRPGSPLAWP